VTKGISAGRLSTSFPTKSVKSQLQTHPSLFASRPEIPYIPPSSLVENALIPKDKIELNARSVEVASCHDVNSCAPVLYHEPSNDSHYENFIRKNLKSKGAYRSRQKRPTKKIRVGTLNNNTHFTGNLNIYDRDPNNNIRNSNLVCIDEDVIQELHPAFALDSLDTNIQLPGLPPSSVVASGSQLQSHGLDTLSLSLDAITIQSFSSLEYVAVRGRNSLSTPVDIGKNEASKSKNASDPTAKSGRGGGAATVGQSCGTEKLQDDLYFIPSKRDLKLQLKQRKEMLLELAPECSGHNHRANLFTVKKVGPNTVRDLWCSRLVRT